MVPSRPLRSGTLFHMINLAASGLGDSVSASTYVLPYLGKKRGIFPLIVFFFFFLNELKTIIYCLKIILLPQQAIPMLSAQDSGGPHDHVDWWGVQNLSLTTVSKACSLSSFQILRD